MITPFSTEEIKAFQNKHPELNNRMKTKIKKKRKPDNTGKNRDSEGKWLPGTSGNLEGKPKGAFSLTAILKAEIQKCPKGQDKKTYAVLIVKKMLTDAIEKGDVQQIKIIWAYIEGMPLQKIGGDPENPLNAQVIILPPKNGND